VKDCMHFYDNPFTTTIGINTDVSNKNPEPSYNRLRNEKPPFNILGTSRFIVDPLENLKNETTNENQIPKKKLHSDMGRESCKETLDQHVLAATKTYEKNFNLTFKTNENKNKDRYITSRERLKKQIALNDVLMTRLTLDVFCL